VRPWRPTKIERRIEVTHKEAPAGTNGKGRLET
jgi:hypothetical protein